MGIPGETDKTMRKSIDFAKELSALGLNPIFGMAIPLPGTKLYKVCENGEYFVKKNPSLKDYQLAYSKEALIDTPSMPSSKLKKWYFKALRETLLVRIKKNPRVLLNLNIVQEFRNHPIRALKIALSYSKSALSK